MFLNNFVDILRKINYTATIILINIGKSMKHISNNPKTFIAVTMAVTAVGLVYDVITNPLEWNTMKNSFFSVLQNRNGKRSNIEIATASRNKAAQDLTEEETRLSYQKTCQTWAKRLSLGTSALALVLNASCQSKTPALVANCFSILLTIAPPVYYGVNNILGRK